jgi:hypothetical protein
MPHVTNSDLNVAATSCSGAEDLSRANNYVENGNLSGRDVSVGQATDQGVNLSRQTDIPRRKVMWQNIKAFFKKVDSWVRFFVGLEPRFSLSRDHYASLSETPVGQKKMPAGDIVAPVPNTVVASKKSSVAPMIITSSVASKKTPLEICGEAQDALYESDFNYLVEGHKIGYPTLIRKDQLNELEDDIGNGLSIVDKIKKMVKGDIGWRQVSEMVESYYSRLSYLD